MNNQLYLQVSAAGRNTDQLALQPNTTLFIGSGHQCGLVIDDCSVQQMHCRVWLDREGTLRIQDWNTDGKTIIDGKSITDETAWQLGQVLQIGTYQVTPVQSVEQPETLANHECNPDEPITEEPTNVQLNDEETHTVEATQTACDTESTAEKTTKSAEFVYGFEFDDEDLDSAAGGFDANGLSHADSAGDDEMSRLQLEVEQLRFEVAERDAELRMLAESNDTAPLEDCENDETVRLVNRLEELLEELHCSDDRILGLEELLRVSDDATRAEQEERKQLESWVAEIEQRVVHRESESDAELSRVRGRMQELKKHYQHAQKQLKQALAGRHENDASVTVESDELAQNLRKQVEELQSRLEAINEENENLRKLTAGNGGENDGDAREQLKAMEQKFLELQVATSRERADMARQREQLERLKDELSHKLNGNSNIGDADSRIRAMRQHLNDIHAQEKLEKQQRKEQTIGGRISRLLSRTGH